MIEAITSVIHMSGLARIYNLSSGSRISSKWHPCNGFHNGHNIQRQSKN